MSHNTYQSKWTECMQELMEQVQIENLEDADHGFQHHALLYIKYLQIYRKLEDCHDQMVHPQKRRAIKKVLKSTIVRILELKLQLINFNPRPKNRFVALDEVVTDLKLNPETVEWKVPRYFLDDKECKEELKDKEEKIDHWLAQFGMPSEPQDLVDKEDPFKVGLTEDQAVAIIQKNERGRVGILKAETRCAWFRTSRKEGAGKRQAEKKEDDDLLESQIAAATRIAAHWKRKVDRRRFLRMREEEFEFLGMAPPKRDPKGAETGIIQEMEQHRVRRKKMLEDADQVFEKALKEQLEWLQKKKGADIKADLLEERRQWILDFCQKPEGNFKFPNEADDFYGRDYDQAQDEDAADGGKDPKGKGKDAKAKDAKAGKDGKKDGKGKGGGAEAADEAGLEVGPSAVVQQFVEQINQYTEIWENRDESNNFDQRHDVELARKAVFPIVEAELRAEVDAMMRDELANLKWLFGEAKKKEKKPPKKGRDVKAGFKAAQKAGKRWYTPVEKLVNKADLMPELIEMGILKKVEPCKLEEFLGEYHFLGAVQRSNMPYCPPPSAQMIRSLIVEHCILPLAQTDIRQKAPTSLCARSLLLYGPKGSGKSMLARAIATETGAMFFDLSPKVICDKDVLSRFSGKNASMMLMYKVLACAQENAPAVIYIDEIDQVFQGGGNKKKKPSPDSASRIVKELCTLIKEDIVTGPHATEQHRILVIGCTSKVDGLLALSGKEKAEFLKAFDEKVWVSFPEYGSRVLLWQKFMENHGVFIDPLKLNISTLAKISEGYPAGSIKQTVARVLTTRRVQQLKNRPLKVQEFIGPLSRTVYGLETYIVMREFDNEASGEKDRMKARQEEEQQNEQAAAGKKGK